MKSISFRLEEFEGPLDLLLSLIEKNKIDICNIEITLLLEQYMEYINTAQLLELELAVDFLEMASTLMYIKSRTLLPKDDTPDEEDPKALLEAQLAEYARCKRAASYLMKKSLWGKLYFRETDETLPSAPTEFTYAVTRLTDAYATVIRRMEGKKPLSPNSFTPLIGTRFISVGSKIIALLRILIKKTNATFGKIFNGMRDRSEIVATFLAILELIRSGRVDVDDNNGDTELTLIKKKAKTL